MVMKAQILKQLEKIEKENDITILYACESGSRAWGLNNSKSDYDIRFIFKRNNLKDYLTLSDRDDVVEVMCGNLDIVGWDVKKALFLHYNSNPNLREWLKSPVIYVDFRQDIFKDLPDFNNAPLKYHYLNIANNNWRRLSGMKSKLSKKTVKMYLHIIRCILAWMTVNDKNSPAVNIYDLLKQVNGLNSEIIRNIEGLIEYYKNGCRGDFSLETTDSWIDDCLKTMRRDFPKNGKKPDLKIYDERFFRIVSGEN